MKKLILGWIVSISLIFLSGCAPTVDVSKTTPTPEAAQGVTATPFQATVPPTIEPTSPPKRAATEVQSQPMVLTSPSIEAGALIDAQFTCTGSNRSPDMQWSGIPKGTQSFALIVEDPDAPSGNFVHWVLFNIPGDRHDLPQGVARDETIAGIGVQGKNDAGETGYTGPCPPPGGPHRYFFKLYALDTRLFLPAGLHKQDLVDGMDGHILAEAEFYATFQRTQAKSGG